MLRVIVQPGHVSSDGYRQGKMGLKEARGFAFAERETLMRMKFPLPIGGLLEESTRPKGHLQLK